MYSIYFFIFLVSDFEINNESSTKLKSFYTITSFPGYDPIKSKVTPMTDKNHQAINEAVAEDVQKFKHVCVNKEALSYEELRIEVYTTKVSADNRPTFLGDLSISLIQLVLGPRDHICVLDHSPIQPITFKFHCESIQETDMTFLIEKFVLKNVQEPSVKITCDALLSKPHKTSQDTVNVDRSNTIISTKFQELKQPVSILQLNQTLFTVTVSTVPSGILNKSTELGKFEITLDQVYQAVNEYDSVFSGTLIGVREYEYELTAKVTNAPSLIQAASGIHEFKENLHEFTNMEKFNISEDAYDYQKSPLDLVGPSCTIPYCDYPTIDVMKVNIKIDELKLKLPKSVKPNSPALNVYIYSNKNVNRKLQASKQPGDFTCSSIELPIQTNMPYLFPNQYIAYEYKENGKLVAYYYINLHNLLSGPTYYEFTMKNVDSNNNSVINLQFTTAVDIKKNIYCEFTSLVVSGFKETRRLGNMTVAISLNHQNTTIAKKCTFDKDNLLTFTDKVVIPFEYNPADPKLKDALFTIKIFEGKNMLAKNKFFFMSIVPLDTVHDKTITFTSNNKNIGDIFSLDCKIKCYTNIDSKGFYLDYNQHKEWSYNNNIVEYPREYTYIPNEQYCYCQGTEDLSKSEKASTIGTFHVLWSNKKIEKDVRFKVGPAKVQIYEVETNNIIFDIPYKRVETRYNIFILQFSSPLVNMICTGSDCKIIANSIKYNMKTSGRKDTIRKSSSIPLSMIDALLQNRMNEVLEGNTLQPIAEEKIVEKTFFLVCNRKSDIRFINVTCPCGKHPYDFELLNVCHLQCKDCETVNELTWLNPEQTPDKTKYQCSSCGKDLVYNDESIKSCYECECGNLFSAICPNCNEVHDAHDLYYKVKCTKCNVENIASQEGCTCQNCSELLPSIFPEGEGDDGGEIGEEGVEPQYDEEGNLIEGEYTEDYDPNQYDEDGNYIGDAEPTE